jgi:hypothetical protein
MNAADIVHLPVDHLLTVASDNPEQGGRWQVRTVLGEHASHADAPSQRVHATFTADRKRANSPRVTTAEGIRSYNARPPESPENRAPRTSDAAPSQATRKARQFPTSRAPATRGCARPALAFQFGREKALRWAHNLPRASKGVDDKHLSALTRSSQPHDA